MLWRLAGSPIGFAPRASAINVTSVTAYWLVKD